jgi:hypothetical protein
MVDGGGCPGLAMAAESRGLVPATAGDNHLVREAMCQTKGIEPALKKAYEDNDDWLTWVYFGSKTGVYRMYPGVAQHGASRCDPTTDYTGKGYDPRLRPWYTVSANGPKDVVLVVDTSGSMAEREPGKPETRLDITKAALVKLVGALADIDYVGLVKFSHNAQTVGSSVLIKATDQNKQNLKNHVSDLMPDGGTNFRAGFATAVEMLKESRSTGATTTCSSVILFMTDGRDSDVTRGDVTTEALIEEIETGLNSLGQDEGRDAPRVFTLSLGAGADDSIVRQISCNNGGVWGSVVDGDDPLGKMSAFFDVFALGMRATDRVVWSHPYEDASGAGLMTTAAVPVFHDRGTLVGSVGLDVLMTKLLEIATVDEISNAIDARGALCFGMELTECEEQLKRDEHSSSQCAPTRRRQGTPLCEEIDGKVFFAPYVTYKLSQAEARAECQANGGDLASGTTPEIRAAFASLSVPSGSWIGLMDDRTDGSFYWVNGDSPTITIAGERTCNLANEQTKRESSEPTQRCDDFWGSSEPDNMDVKQQAGAHCVYADPRGATRNWADESCAKTHHFICQRDAKARTPVGCQMDMFDVYRIQCAALYGLARCAALSHLAWGVSIPLLALLFQ